MIARSLCLVGLLLISVVIQADDQQNDERNTAELIEAVQARLVLEEEVRGAFEQDKYIAVLPQPLRSEGRFSYSPEQGLDWETLRPIANRLTFNDQGISQTVDGKVVWQVDANQPAAVTISQVMSSVLAMNWEVLQNYFQLQGQVDDSGWQLHLEPRDASLKQVVEAIAIAGDRDVESLTLMEANGDRTEIRFRELDTPQP